MIFGKTVEEWKVTGAEHTPQEIYQQPKTWRKTLEIIRGLKPELEKFIKQVTDSGDFDIIFSGAGTSEYVGNAAMHCLNEKFGFHVRSHGSTDIVVSPRKYLSEAKSTLLVNFARSGNSKESMGTIRAAEKVCKNLYHLIITCNPNGTLALEATNLKNCFLVQLPPETNDQGMAMTSSFSDMYLAALCALQLDRFEEFAADVLKMCDATQKVLDNYQPLLKLVDEYDYDRMVFLGSAELKEIGHEAMLKTLELTVGKVAPLFDTPIGFRHGPKSILDEKTLTIIMMSDEPLARKYEKDLVEELHIQKDGNFLLVIDNAADADLANWADLCINYEVGKALTSDILGLGYVVAGQMLSLFKSQKLGFTTDRPQTTSARNKLVKGISIYPV